MKNQQKMNLYEFSPIIYPYKLWIVVDKNIHSILNTFYDNDGKEIADLENVASTLQAFTMSVMKKDCFSYGVVVFFRNRKQMTYKTIAHEASHAAKFLFNHIGADVEPHEPFEYVVGWIAECCGKVKNKST